MQEFKKYKKIKNRLNQRIKDLEEEYWGKLTSDMEHDLYGNQKKKMLHIMENATQ